MATYDPKRPRPAAGDAEDPAPVEALLDAPDVVPADDATIVDVPETSPVAEVDLRAVTTNGSSAASGPLPRPTHEVPVAAAPEEGTTNRAVLIAAIVTSVVAAIVVLVAFRRRRG